MGGLHPPKTPLLLKKYYDVTGGLHPPKTPLLLEGSNDKAIFIIRFLKIKSNYITPRTFKLINNVNHQPSENKPKTNKKRLSDEI